MEFKYWLLLASLFTVRLVYSPLLGGFIIPGLLQSRGAWTFLPLWGDGDEILTNQLFDIKKPLTQRLTNLFQYKVETRYDPVAKIFQYLIFALSGYELKSSSFRIANLMIHTLNGIILIPLMLNGFARILSHNDELPKSPIITDSFEPEQEEQAPHKECVEVEQHQRDSKGYDEAMQLINQNIIGMIYIVHPIYVKGVCLSSSTGGLLAISCILITTILLLRQELQQPELMNHLAIYFFFLMSLLSTPFAILSGIFPVVCEMTRKKTTITRLVLMFTMATTSVIGIILILLQSFMKDDSMLGLTFIDWFALFPERCFLFCCTLFTPSASVLSNLISTNDLILISPLKLGKFLAAGSIVKLMHIGTSPLSKQSKLALLTSALIVMAPICTTNAGTAVLPVETIHVAFIFVLPAFFEVMNTFETKTFKKRHSQMILLLIIAALGCKTTHEINQWRNQDLFAQKLVNENPSDWYTLQLIADELYIQNAVEEAKQYYFLCDRYAPNALQSVKMGLLRAKWYILLGQRNEACTIYANYFEKYFEQSKINGMIYGNHAICTILNNHNSNSRANAKQLFQIALSDGYLSIANKNALLTNLERVENIQDNDSFEAVLLY